MQKGQANHPPSLRIFFGTEMWERYGFYVVQTLLALYLALHFEWEDKKIYPLVGSFTALTYISPVIGGWIADQFLGQKRTILTGAAILFLSYLTLGLMASNLGLIIALSGAAVGTGLLKPNISSLLGNEYPEGAPNRESGFTIFYMGITTGIILGTTLPSYLNRLFGWPCTFLSAAIGMIIAFCVFLYGVHRYQIADYNPKQYQTHKILYAAIMILLLWLGSFYILRDLALANGVFAAVVLLSLTYLLSSIKQESAAQARQTIIIGLLCLISIMFWAFYFQMFLSFILFLKRVVQPTLFGFYFPPPYYVAIQSLGMIVFGFFLARNKHHSNKIQRSINIGNKFLLAMVLMTIAFALITLVCYLSQDSNLLYPLYIIPAYLIISLAELLLSPVGLAAITMLSSHKRVSTMMGIFFVSLGLGGFLSGKLATITAIDETNLSIMGVKAHYATSFTHLLYILIAATIVSFILNRIIKHLILLTPNTK